MTNKKYYSAENSFGGNAKNELVQHPNLIESNQNEVKKLCEEYLAFSQQFLFPISLESFARNRGYAESSLYVKPNSQPKIKVLRHLSQYTDGNIGIQDEICIAENKSRFQFNFEIDSAGGMIKFPIKYDNMAGFINEYKIASQNDGNSIYCDFRPKGCYTSLNGWWVKTEDYDQKLLEKTRNEIVANLSQLPSNK